MPYNPLNPADAARRARDLDTAQPTQPAAHIVLAASVVASSPVPNGALPAAPTIPADGDANAKGWSAAVEALRTEATASRLALAATRTDLADTRTKLEALSTALQRAGITLALLLCISQTACVRTGAPGSADAGLSLAPEAKAAIVCGGIKLGADALAMVAQGLQSGDWGSAARGAALRYVTADALPCVFGALAQTAPSHADKVCVAQTVGRALLPGEVFCASDAAIVRGIMTSQFLCESTAQTFRQRARCLAGAQ